MLNTMHNEVDEEDHVSSVGDTSDEKSDTCRYRCFTRNIDLDKYVLVHGKIPINVDPISKKHVGQCARMFSNSIGSYVRDVFPIRCTQMKDVPKEIVMLVKNRLLDHFILDLTSPLVHEFLESKMQKVFKEYVGELTKHYKHFANPEATRANPPKRLRNDIEEYHTVCDEIENRNWQKTLEANQKSQGELPFNHKADSKSFLQILEEEKRKTVDGDREFEPIELVERTHTFKIDGSWVNPVVESAHKRMKEIQEASTQWSKSLDPIKITQTVFRSRSGYVKGVSYGPNPPSESRSVNCSPSTSIATQMQYEAKIRDLKDEIERNNIELCALKAEIAGNHKKQQEEFNENHRKQKEEMDELKKMLEQLTQTYRQ